MNMHIAVLCDPGTEDLTAHYLESDFGCNIKSTYPGTVTCTVESGAGESLEAALAYKVIQLYYCCQAAHRILVCTVEGDSLEDAASRFNFPDWWSTQQTFRMNASGYTDTQETIKKCVSLIEPESKVDLDLPDISLWALRIEKNGNDHHLIGIDLSQLDLHKREYRIYTNPSMLRSTTAFSMLQEAGYTASKTLLDPFCGSGTVAIEAALHATSTSPLRFCKHDMRIARSGFCDEQQMDAILSHLDTKSTTANPQIYAYDALLKRVNCTKHNAKIGSVLDSLHVSRVEVDWVDTKFENGQVDCIVTQPPALTEANQKVIGKVYAQLMKRGADILASDGIMVLCTHDTEGIASPAESHGLGITSTRKVYMGKQMMHFVSLRKVSG
ncbi:MAG: hypothetical protein ACOCWQ_00190 [Nanoarchaeota archaeon]